ncbi:MAG: MFS transporter [Thermodesulfovibrionales bacterium]
MGLSPFLLLCTTGFFAIFSSTISKSPVLPLFAAYLGGNPLEVGIVSSISAFMGVIASVPAGVYSDKVGRRKMLILSSIIFATAPFLYLIVTNIYQLMFVRFYHGLATAIFVPVAMAYISELYNKKRGERLGWFSTATLLGRFLAPMLSGVVISIFVFLPDWGYKAVYLLCAVTGTLTLIIAIALPNTKTTQRMITNQELFRNFKTIILNRGIMFTCIVESSVLFAYGTFETFLPLYAVRAGYTAYEIGAMLSVQVITLALSKPFMGKLSDKHGRRAQIVIGSSITAISIGAIPFLNNFLYLLLLSIIVGLSLSIVTSATSAYIADLSKDKTYGSAMGLLGSIMDIGHTTGPLVSGIVALKFGIDKSFFGASAVVAITGLLFLTFSITTRDHCCPK